LLTENRGLIGPEVSDRAALDIALDRAEVLVTNADILSKTRDEWHLLPGVDQLQVVASSGAASRSRSAPTRSCSAWTF
jgi:putative transport protein